LSSLVQHGSLLLWFWDKPNPQHVVIKASQIIKDNGDPNYAAFDETRFDVVLMSGLPSAGKDNWIWEYLPDWTVISLDELRQAMNISPKDDQGAVGERARAIAKEYMRAEKSFV
jgi:hypothetical protein